MFKHWFAQPPVVFLTSPPHCLTLFPLKSGMPEAHCDFWLLCVLSCILVSSVFSLSHSVGPTLTMIVDNLCSVLFLSEREFSTPFTAKWLHVEYKLKADFHCVRPGNVQDGIIKYHPQCLGSHHLLTSSLASCMKCRGSKENKQIKKAMSYKLEVLAIVPDLEHH